MAIIRSISVCAARVPLDRVTSFSNRTVYARDYGLVKVTSEDGVTGIGFCYVGSAGGELLPIAVEKLLAPVLIGRDSLDVEALWREMYQEACCRAAPAWSCAPSASSTPPSGTSTRAAPACRCTATWARPAPTACWPTPAAATTSTARPPSCSARRWRTTSRSASRR